MDEAKEKITTIRVRDTTINTLRVFQKDKRQSNESIILQLVDKARELRQLKKMAKNDNS